MRRGALFLGVAVAAYGLAALAWIAGDRRAERQAFERPGSSLDRGPEGTSLARAVLAERAGRPRPGEPARLASLLRRVEPDELPARAVVFRLEPEETPFLGRWRDEGGEDDGGKTGKDGKEESRDAKGGRKEKTSDPETSDAGDEPVPSSVRAAPLLTAGEEAWVRGGGRLVLGVAESYGPLGVEDLRAPRRLAKVFPVWPGVRRLALAEKRSLSGPPVELAHAVVLAGDRPVVSILPLGRGEVVLLACPEIFHNARLDRADHLALLAALSGPPGARAIFFDERAHGLERRRGPLSLLLGWGFGPALALALFAAAAALWRARSALGPPERDDPDLRSDAVDLVDALGELYDRALRRVDALRLHHDNLVRSVAAETGLSGPALAARLAALLPGFAPPVAGAAEISREELLRELRTLNQAYGRIDVRDRKRRA